MQPFVFDMENLQLGEKFCHSIKILGFYNCSDESLTFLPNFIWHLKSGVVPMSCETLSAMSLFLWWILSNVYFKDIMQSVSKAMSQKVKKIFFQE